MAPSGLLVVDKPTGMTSHDVVGRVRRILGTRKVGHAGTLDPLATGVLVIGVERATRLLGHLALRDKRYLATIRLGFTTVTDDSEGEVLALADPDVLEAVTDEAIRAAAMSLTGAIEQRPSSVSAIKVDGRRAYDRVRSGEAVDLASRAVTVSRLDVTDIRRGETVDLDVDVECSTGTYVRALARDMGADLGVGGHLTRLRRTRVGPFDETVAIGLDQLAADADPAALLIGMPAAASCFPTWQVGADQARAVLLGQRIEWAGPAGVGEPAALVGEDGRFLALAVGDAGVARYLAVFA